MEGSVPLQVTLHGGMSLHPARKRNIRFMKSKLSDATAPLRKFGEHLPFYTSFIYATGSTRAGRFHSESNVEVGLSVADHFRS